MTGDHVNRAGRQFAAECREAGLLVIEQARLLGYLVVVHTTQTSSTRVQFTDDGPSFCLDTAPEQIFKRAWRCWREQLTRRQSA